MRCPAFIVAACLVYPTAALTQAAPERNCVLELDGDGDYVEPPAPAFTQDVSVELSFIEDAQAWTIDLRRLSAKVDTLRGAGGRDSA